MASSLLFGSLQTANAPESAAAVPVRIDETVSRFEERPGVDQATSPTPEASPTKSQEAPPAKKKQAKPKPEKVSWPTPTPPPPKPVAVKASGSDSSGKLTPAKGNICKASYYHEPQMTASGERFNPNAMTAAHKTLPLGSRVKVTNPANGKTVIVRINDRGPYISGRCLDLSRASFAKIGNVNQGVMKVVWQRV